MDTYRSCFGKEAPALWRPSQQTCVQSKEDAGVCVLIVGSDVYMLHALWLQLQWCTSVCVGVCMGRCMCAIVTCVACLSMLTCWLHTSPVLVLVHHIWYMGGVSCRSMVFSFCQGAECDVR